MAATLRVGIPRSSPPLVSECVSKQAIPDGGKFQFCQKPGLYIELMEFLAEVMNVSLEWHLFDSNNVVNQWLRQGKLDVSARMKEQTAFLNDPDLIACDYGLYEKMVYLLKRPAASDMNPLYLMAPFDIWIWIKIVVVLIVIFTFMIYFRWIYEIPSKKIEQSSSPSSSSSSSTSLRSLLGNALFDTFSHFVKQYDLKTARSVGELIFILTVIHGLYFLTVCYEYFLLDGMVDVVKIDPSMSTDRFYEFVLNNNYKILAYPDSDSRYFRSLQSNVSQSSMLINDLLFIKQRFLEVKNSDEAFMILLNSSSNQRLLFPREMTKAKYFVEKNHDFMFLSVIDDPFSYSSFVFPRNSPYLSQCNKWMKISTGIISRLIKHYVAKLDEQYVDIAMEKLQLKHIVSLVWLWILGLILALAVFSMEFIWKNRNKEKFEVITITFVR